MIVGVSATDGGDRGIVIEDGCEDGMQNLGGSLVLMLMRAGILAGEVVVMAVEVMVVAGGTDIFFGKTLYVSNSGGVFRREF